MHKAGLSRQNIAGVELAHAWRGWIGSQTGYIRFFVLKKGIVYKCNAGVVVDRIYNTGSASTEVMSFLKYRSIKESSLAPLGSTELSYWPFSLAAYVKHNIRDLTPSISSAHDRWLSPVSWRALHTSTRRSKPSSSDRSRSFGISSSRPG